MSFVPPTDDPSPNKGRAALAFLFGMASSRSGATTALGRAQHSSLTRRQRVETNLAVLLSVITFIAGALLGWMQMRTLAGVVIGLTAGAVLTLVGGIVWNIFSMTRRSRSSA